MSYIHADMLAAEFRRLYAEAHPGEPLDGIFLYDPDNKPFIAEMGGQKVRFTIPEDMLHSSPLRIVSERFLKPLIKRLQAEIAHKGASTNGRD